MGFVAQPRTPLRQLNNDFAEWRLEVGGLVEQPLSLSLADLRAMPKQKQITKHNCFQGWSGVAEWADVPVTEILKHCKPLPEAHYLVFTSYGRDDQVTSQHEVAPTAHRDRAALAHSRSQSETSTLPG